MLAVYGRPRDRVRLGVARTTRKRGTDSLESPWGWYHTVDDLGGGIRHRRAQDTVPPFTSSATVRSGAAFWSPRIDRDSSARLLCLYVEEDGSGGFNGRESWSDDDGETWTEADNLFTGATYVDVAADRLTGLILRGGLISGTLWVTRQYPGDSAASAEINTGVALDEGQFSLAAAHEGPGRWLLIGVSGGAAVNYASADDGESWTAV